MTENEGLATPISVFFIEHLIGLKVQQTRRTEGVDGWMVKILEWKAKNIFEN